MSEEKDRLDKLFPGLSGNLMKQLELDVSTGMAFVYPTGLVYKDGRYLTFDEEDRNARYRVGRKNHLFYLGPRMHVAIESLLECEPDAPTLNGMFGKPVDNRLVTGVAWLMVHGFNVLSGYWLKAMLRREVRLEAGPSVQIIPLEACGRLDGQGGVLWTVSSPVCWQPDFKKAVEMTGISKGEGRTPREALSNYLPVLTMFSRVMKGFESEEAVKDE